MVYDVAAAAIAAAPAAGDAREASAMPGSGIAVTTSALACKRRPLSEPGDSPYITRLSRSLPFSGVVRQG